MSSPSGAGPFLIFEVGEAAEAHTGPATFALDVAHVLQVLEAHSVTSVPLTPSVVEGIINHHGRILTVIDPAPLLGLPAQPQPVGHVAILRHRHGGGSQVGLKVARIVEITAADRLESVEVSAGPCVDRVVRRDGTLVHVISYGALRSELGRAFAESAERDSTPSEA